MSVLSESSVYRSNQRSGGGCDASRSGWELLPRDLGTRRGVAEWVLAAPSGAYVLSQFSVLSEFATPRNMLHIEGLGFGVWRSEVWNIFSGFGSLASESIVGRPAQVLILGYDGSVRSRSGSFFGQ